MSRETLEWLNNHTLIGFTDEFSTAWHYDGSTDNHFTAAVPIDRVHQLFEWQAEFRPIAVKGDVHWDDDIWAESDKYLAVCHSETMDVFNIVSKRYAIHQYNEWLVEQVQGIMDVSAGDLAIGSAGLLRKGGQAWVQVRPPEYVNIGGEMQLPWILATTSHDGTLATQYKAQRQRAVCDNTLAVALGEKTAEYRVRHLRGNDVKLGEARAALDLMFEMQGEFDAEVERLMNTEFKTALFRDLNSYIHPPVEPKVEDGKVTNQRSINNRDRTIAELEELWFDDDRVSDYKDTVWGALQAHNTWFHWYRTSRTGGEDDLLKARQIQSNISGDTAAYDQRVRSVVDDLISVG